MGQGRAIYHAGTYVAWVAVFVAAYGYAIVTYGTWGIAAGWIAAAIVASIAAFLWPALLVAALVLFLARQFGLV